MSNTPSELRHMLPCPFCGGDPRHDAHATDCYFMLVRKFGKSDADMSIALEARHAWNRRTPQPVVREPMSPEQDTELIRQMLDALNTCIQACDYLSEIESVANAQDAARARLENT